MAGIARGVVDWSERRLDGAVVSAGESLKTAVQESPPAFDRWLRHHRQRIQPIFQHPHPPPTNNPLRTGSQDTLKAGQEGRGTEPFGEPFEELLPALPPSLDESSDESDDDYTSHPPPVDLRRGLPGAKARRRRRKQKFDAERLLGSRDRVFAHQKLNTGMMEDLRLRMLLGIDSVVTAVRSALHRRFQALKAITLSSILFAPQRVVLGLVRLHLRLLFAILGCFLGLRSQEDSDPSAPAPPGNLGTSGPRKMGRDTRDTKDLVTSQGYPYERYEVVTRDGYILRLERLPRPGSTNVIYFQHGVVDNSFAWFGHMEGESGTAVAFRAYDAGSDVFVGTLRGCGGQTDHVNPHLPSEDYWNFSVNEHAFQDLRAFVDKIHQIKAEDMKNLHPDSQTKPDIKLHPDTLTKPSSAAEEKSAEEGSSGEWAGVPEGGPKGWKLTFIAHSMGAMATLMYLIYSRLHGRPHGVSAAILLSPAGYHKTAPLIVYIMGPLLNFLLRFFPGLVHSFHHPSEFFRYVMAKVIEDVNSNYTGRVLASWFVTKVIGGSGDEHTFVNIHNITYNVFTGTSKGVYRHFWQNWQRQRFEAFDLGPDQNLRLYGSRQPLNFLDHYDKLDLPVYFAMGLTDTLIEPVSVVTHYATLKEKHPHLAFLRAFPRLGHIDFTVGANEALIAYLLETIRTINSPHCPTSPASTPDSSASIDGHHPTRAT